MIRKGGLNGIRLHQNLTVALMVRGRYRYGLWDLLGYMLVFLQGLLHHLVNIYSGTAL